MKTVSNSSVLITIGAMVISNVMHPTPLRPLSRLYAMTKCAFGRSAAPRLLITECLSLSECGVTECLPLTECRITESLLFSGLGITEGIPLPGCGIMEGLPLPVCLITAGLPLSVCLGVGVTSV